MSRLRLQVILSRAGVASRRAAEEMITAGRVAVDGQVVRELGTQADPFAQKITVDGKPLPSRPALEYWMVHKPVGVVSTVRDPQGRRRVVDMVPPQEGRRLFPVGRLDQDSEGLVLLTNDGELAHRLTHPRYQVAKHYRVWVSGTPSTATVESLRQGVELEDGVTAPARVYLKSSGLHGSKMTMTLLEGRKREIRRMCELVGHPVHRLVRVGLGPLRLGDLPLGGARRLSMAEVTQLRQEAGLAGACKPARDGVKKVLAGGKRGRKPPTRNHPARPADSAGKRTGNKGR